MSQDLPLLLRETGVQCHSGAQAERYCLGAPIRFRLGGLGLLHVFLGYFSRTFLRRDSWERMELGKSHVRGLENETSVDLALHLTVNQGSPPGCLQGNEHIITAVRELLFLRLLVVVARGKRSCTALLCLGSFSV